VQACTPAGAWDSCSCEGALDASTPMDASPDGPLPPLPMTLDDPSRCLKGGARAFVFSQSRNRPDGEIVGVPFPPSPMLQSRIDISLNELWLVGFDTSEMDEQIQAKRYDYVECGVPTYKKAGFIFNSSPKIGCWPEHVTVVVHEVQWTGQILDRFTMTFELEEPNRAGKTIGCMHYER
jgi:hypothetical protein